MTHHFRAHAGTWVVRAIVLAVVCLNAAAQQPGSDKGPSVGAPTASDAQTAPAQSAAQAPATSTPPVAAPPSIAPPSTKAAVTSEDLRAEGERITKALKDDSIGHIVATFGIGVVLAVLGLMGNDYLQRKRLTQEDRLARERLRFEGDLASRKAALEAAQSLVELRVHHMEELYGPLRALLTQSKGVYDQLCLHLMNLNDGRYRWIVENDISKVRSFQFLDAGGKWKTFRLLEHMPELYGEEVNAVPLISEVISIGEEIVKVIRERAGRVLPVQRLLTTTFGEYLSHFVVLREMHLTMMDKTRRENPRHYQVGFYPRRFNALVESGFDLIANELAHWEGRLHRISYGMTVELAEPGTLAYYNREADEYVSRTLNADMSHAYEPFLKRIAVGGFILDVGCGSGRDLLTFRERGYEPVGIDPSRELVIRARAISGEQCMVMGINELPWAGRFHGVWAVASLLHMPRKDLPTALTKLIEQLAPGGALYFSVQEGTGERVSEDGRYFSDYSMEQVHDVLSRLTSLEDVHVWTTPDADPARVGVVWINALATKHRAKAEASQQG
jgi:hypothetical protein